MAVSLDCSPGTVKSRLHYAIQNLRESVAASDAEAPVHGSSLDSVSEGLVDRDQVDSNKPLQDQEL